MTFIEFFEKNALDNICSCLVKAPERVVLLGDKLSLMQKYAKKYKSVLHDRGADVEFVCRTVNKNRLQTITDTLSAIVNEYDYCVFDLTGGEDLCLVALGIVFEKYKDKNIKMHRFNVRNNTLVCGGPDGETAIKENPQLSVGENIRIYGGDVVFSEQGKDKTFRWDMNDGFKRDINSIWNVCREDPRLWNAQISVFEAAEKISGNAGGLTVSVPADDLKSALKRGGNAYFVKQNVMDGLYRAGLITAYSVGDDVFSVTFKNLQVKRCLTVAGRALEMKVFLAAEDARENDGEKTYNDVMNGVYIDWDGDVGEEKDRFDTVNEIDVMMMHGLVPVFVSCKNGDVDKDELYKLKTVAMRFGGKYSKMILVATSLDNSDSSNYLRQRAEDMGIRLVEGYSRDGKYKPFTKLDDDEFGRAVRSFWS